jgi:hypothetical protein
LLSTPLNAGKVVEEISSLRGELAKDGVVIAQLEDVARRIDKGPSKEELRYAAAVL